MDTQNEWLQKLIEEIYLGENELSATFKPYTYLRLFVREADVNSTHYYSNNCRFTEHAFVQTCNKQGHTQNMLQNYLELLTRRSSKIKEGFVLQNKTRINSCNTVL